MQTVADMIAAGLPEPLWDFARECCEISADALRLMPGGALPEPARQLLSHDRDMTSTLSAHHGSALSVDVLQRRQRDGIYLREVFLRTLRTGEIVEFGIIAVVLDQFSEVQQEAIQAGVTPLGGLLHQFRIPFESTPLSFFSITGAHLPEGRRLAANGAPCYGRFNRLAKPPGEPLAWIMEILPPP